MAGSDEGNVVLVTGGLGFLASHVVECLGIAHERGLLTVRRVILMDLPRAPLTVELNRIFATLPFPVDVVRGDVTDGAVVRSAMRGVSVCIHTAALISMMDVTNACWRVNVGGTRQVVAACREQGVRALVHVSTMDVLVDLDAAHPSRLGRVEMHEGMPYAKQPLFGKYAVAKIEAERLALGADNGSGGSGLRTCALRPFGLYGERDTTHTAKFLAAARTGQLIVYPGRRDALFQHTYVGNVAWLACVAAARLLSSSHGDGGDGGDGGGSAAGGQAFSAGDDSPPCSLLDGMRPFLEDAGFSLPKHELPFWLAYCLAVVLEVIFTLLYPLLRREPELTRCAVHATFSSHTFSWAKSRELLGFAPLYSHEEAMERSRRWWLKQHQQQRQEGTAPNKAA